MRLPSLVHVSDETSIHKLHVPPNAAEFVNDGDQPSQYIECYGNTQQTSDIYITNMFVSLHYGNYHIVFDEYEGSPSIKDVEQARIKKLMASDDVNLDHTAQAWICKWRNNK